MEILHSCHKSPTDQSRTWGPGNAGQIASISMRKSAFLLKGSMMINLYLLQWNERISFQHAHSGPCQVWTLSLARGPPGTSGWHVCSPARRGSCRRWWEHSRSAGSPEKQWKAEFKESALFCGFVLWTSYFLFSTNFPFLLYSKTPAVKSCLPATPC